jgi:hypothetical protein
MSFKEWYGRPSCRICGDPVHNQNCYKNNQRKWKHYCDKHRLLKNRNVDVPENSVFDFSNDED